MKSDSQGDRSNGASWFRDSVLSPWGSGQIPGGTICPQRGSRSLHNRSEDVVGPVVIGYLGVEWVVSCLLRRQCRTKEPLEVRPPSVRPTLPR